MSERKDKLRKYQKKYREKNKGKFQEYMAKYREEHKEELRARRLEKYASNREEVLARERDRLQELKKNPTAYEEYRKRKRGLYAKRRAEGKIPPYREIKKRWDEKNREKNRLRHRQRRNQDRQTAIVAYGGKCDCCGESLVEFLAIDHVNGNGNKHRKSLSPAQRREFPRYLKKLGFPEGFRILCHNCNQARSLYGYCPHEKLKKANCTRD